MKKKIACACLALGLCVGMLGGAYAASNNETISALLNREVKVVYNGVEQHMTDAAGTAVYPISYNNTTYLPVRAVSAMLGLPIEFDAEAYAVVMGAKETQPAALTSLTNSGGTEYSSIIRDAGELKVATGDGLQTYTTGIYFDIWNASASADKYRAILFNVKGYSTLTFTAWSDIDSKVIVYDQDGNVFAQLDLAANSAVTKTYTLDADTTQLGFAADGKTTAQDGTLKILDATVQ